MATMKPKKPPRTETMPGIPSKLKLGAPAAPKPKMMPMQSGAKMPMMKKGGKVKGKC